MDRRMLRFAAIALIGSAAQSAAAAPAELSVLTYNVEGLPFPVRIGRSAQVARIAASLRQLRRAGRQPRVIVLQEAFTPEAKAIAARAGYRYVADGPSATQTGAPARLPADRAFAEQASWWHGERSGKWADSGLRIASDYPIVAIHRMPFPAFACAGFDCLANKGMLAVAVKVPGTARPIAILATHLNARRAAHVAVARSLYAYHRQVDALGEFVRAVVSPAMPMVFAGDFNAGRRLDRRGYLIRSAALWHGAAPPQVAMDNCLGRYGCRKAGAADLRYSFHRARDWQFFAAGRDTTIRLAGLNALFGHDPRGSMLSDHVGYVAAYRYAASAAPRIRLAAR